MVCIRIVWWIFWRGMVCGALLGAVARGRDTGRALLIACLHAMRFEGYGYAIIGGVGPIEFYQKTVGATIIEDSTPGVYAGMLRQS